MLRRVSGPKLRPHRQVGVKRLRRSFDAEILFKGPGATSRRGQAAASSASDSAVGNGLKVMAIRKAPIPIAQEPT
jgi:hypothetical protein